MSAPAVIQETPEARQAREYSAQLRDQAVLREAQSANARANKLEKLSRKDPTIRDLLDEHRAVGAALQLTREKLAGAETTAETATADATQAREDLANMSRELIELRGVLGQAQKDLADRAVSIEALKTDVEGLRHERASLAKEIETAQGTAADQTAELVRLREQLAQALKGKK